MFIAAIVIIFVFLMAMGAGKKKQPKATKPTYRPSPKAALRSTPPPRVSSQKASGLPAKLHSSVDPDIIDVAGPGEPIPRSNNPATTPIGASSHVIDVYQSAWSSLGKRNKKKVPMTEDEASMLDQLYYSSAFFNEPFCQSVILTLFLALHRALDKEFWSTTPSLDDRLDHVARLVCITQDDHFQNNNPDVYTLRYRKNDILQLLMKLCENAVREQYDYKRRLQILPFYNSASDPRVHEALENLLLTPAARQLESLTQVIPVPDDKGETALNTLSPTRWKQKFEAIKSAYTQSKDAKAYKTEVIRLGRLNKKNPSVEHIYFEAAKFIGKEDKILGLTLYCYYVYSDQQSAKIDDKQLPKTLLKALLTNPNQETEFTNILTDLKTKKDLKATLTALPEIYAIKRKKIELDSTIIREAEHALDDTVELLNEYLADEDLSTIEETAAYKAQSGPTGAADPEEDEPVDGQLETLGVPQSDTSPILQPPVAVATQLPVASDVQTTTSRYLSIISLNLAQIALLDIFEKQGFSIKTEDLDTFAREHKTFKNQLVNSLNEAFFETLDDSIIEEEDDQYTINKDYFKRILQP
ncbi:MAG TPA: tellurite resistance TerB C-terminal domain-containing protein [Puia sp.]|nr:tellurite resistance TerB C-terminal domain-containing protein [Puia sp.]